MVPRVADTIFRILTDFFARYGYWVVFFGVMLENGGIPVPGETVLIFAGFLAYRGEVHLMRAIATAIAGATVGDSLGYCLGRFGGTAFVEKYRKLFPFFSRRFDKAQTLFVKHGHWAVFIGRFITGLRVFAGVLAGLFRMRYPRFLFFNFSGAVGWATTFGCVGFLFGSNWDRLVRLVERFDRITLAAVAVAALITWIVFRVKRRRAR
jgi:membrane-associated protein